MLLVIQDFKIRSVDLCYEKTSRQKKYENKKYVMTDYLSTTEVYTNMYMGKEGN